MTTTAPEPDVLHDAAALLDSWESTALAAGPDDYIGSWQQLGCSHFPTVGPGYTWIPGPWVKVAARQESEQARVHVAKHVATFDPVTVRGLVHAVREALVSLSMIADSPRQQHAVRAVAREEATALARRLLRAGQGLQ